MITNKKLICLKKLKDSAEPSASLKDVSEYIFESVCITLYIREFQNKFKIVNWNYNYNGGFFFRNINESINIYISFNWYVHLFILIISEHLFIYQYIFSCLLFGAGRFLTLANCSRVADECLIDLSAPVFGQLFFCLWKSVML